MFCARVRRLAFSRLLSSSALILGALALPAQATTWVQTAGKPFTPDAGLGAVAVSADKPMHVLVSLKRQNPDLLASMYQNLFTPGSPQYHQFLTVDERISLFSPSQAQVDRVTAYLHSQGFANITVSKGRTLVQADGTAAIAAKAFNTSFVKFKQGKEEVFANTAVAQVPASLGDIVLAINGLQNAWRMRTGLELDRQKSASQLGPIGVSANRAILDTIQRAQASPARGKTALGNNPTRPVTRAAKTCGPVAAMPLSDLSVIAGYPPTAWDIAYDAGCTADGSGSTIAISVYGDDMTQVIADLRKMESVNGYSFVPVEVRITTAIATPDTSGDDEWDLDSQSSTAIAGNVKKLIFYTTDTSTDLVSEYTAFADNADAIAGNMSYGSCDALNSVTSNPTVGLLPAATASDPEFQAATMVGLSWFASTGDDGGSCSPVNAEGVPDAGVPGGANYPATSPYVTAVGGSSLFTDANYNYVEETAWTSGGGGISAIEQAPAWQTSSGAVPSALVGGATSLKGVPDIAMNAGVYVPEAVVESAAMTIVNGANENVVGTSLSSPLATGSWARFQASHCQKLAFAAEVYYSLDTTTGPLSTATGFNDITLGSNGTYEATTGWDYTTGFGTLDLTNVDAALDVSAKRCTPVTSIPTAVLTSAQTSGTTTAGPAPFSVDFSGAASSDSTGLSIDYYAIDFGDGSPVVVQAAAPPAMMPMDTVGGTAASTTNYGPSISHTYTSPGTYTATLTVRNSAGIASVNSAQLVITVGGVPLACTAGGELVVPASAVAAGTEGVDLFMGADMLEGTYFSEPPSGNGQLYITMNLMDLSTVYPALRWVTYFDVNGDTTNNYYVSMDTSTGTPSYTYGLHTLVPIAGDSEYTVSGTLDALSTDNAAAPGTITLVLDLTSIPLKVGDTLTSISSAVRTTAPDDPTGTLPVPGGEGLTQDSSGAIVNYTIVGNSACAAATTGGGTTGSSTGSSTGGTSTGGTSTGGTSTGGTSTGGTSTGGSSSGGTSGGSASGGTATGGTSTGGTSTGGASTGGTSSGGSSSGTSTGGASSGGSSSGGTSTGGSSSGGSSTGGSASGGSSTGGSASGGTATGGSSTGGTSTSGSSGGTSTGGASTGGSASGGSSTGGSSSNGSSTGGTSSGTVTVTAPGNGTSGSFGLGLIPLAGLAAIRRKRRGK